MIITIVGIGALRWRIPRLSFFPRGSATSAGCISLIWHNAAFIPDEPSTHLSSYPSSDSLAYFSFLFWLSHRDVKLGLDMITLFCCTICNAEPSPPFYPPSTLVALGLRLFLCLRLQQDTRDVNRVACVRVDAILYPCYESKSLKVVSALLWQGYMQ